MESKKSNSKSNKPPRQSLRIIWAIVAKDTLEALKNKNTVAIILVTLLMTIFYYYMPFLESRGEPPRVRVYDAGESNLVALLDSSEAVNLKAYPSQENVIDALRNNYVPTLGLVIPEEFDRALAENQEVALQGYVLSWVTQTDAEELQQTIENEIAGLLGKPVSILLDSSRFSLEPDSHGIGPTASIALVFVVVMIGLIMIPHLMLEEKQTRTMEVLLISPASVSDLVIGKAIVGLFYCLVGAAVALAVFSFLVFHWWLAILTVVIGALFTVSLGLLLGSIIESRAQLTIWAWVFIIPLLMPVFLSLMEELLPATLSQILQFFPTVVMLNLVRTSYAAVIPLNKILLQLAWLAAWAGAGLVSVSWLVRYQDRQVSKDSTSKFAEMYASTVVEGGSHWYSKMLKSLSLGRKSQTFQKTDAVASSRLDTETPGDTERKHSSPRIIWAIAAKDIAGTLKNKLMLSIIVGTVFIVASGAVPRMLLMGRNSPTAIVYDPGSSSIFRSLAASEDVRLGITDSFEEMQEIVGEAPELLLGLIVPEDFEQKTGSGEQIILDGYVVHWADAEKIDQQVSYFQELLGQASGSRVQINISEQRLYPPPTLEGQSIMFVLLVAIVILTMGITLVPLLLVEEKSAHTLEVLLVSPARIYEVVIGKALAGGFYCLLAVLVVFFLNRFLVVNWGVALLAVLLGGAFAVALGLLVGIISDNPTTVGMWGAILILGLFGVTFLSTLVTTYLPPIAQSLLEYLPTNAMAELLGYSLAAEFPVSQMWANSAALLVAALMAFGLLAWRLQLTDR